jgi:hypothetical protein
MARPKGSKNKPRPEVDKLTRPFSETINNRLTRDSEFAREYLLELGWRERNISSPWRWYQKNLPAAHYTLKDAVSLENSRGRTHRILRSA